MDRTVIPFFNLQSLHQEYLDELKQKASSVIESGNYILGTQRFEEEFAEYTGASYCSGVANGTAALHLALLALGIKEGDEVITVGYTFKATVAAIMYVGATPVYVEIDKNTFCMDPSLIESKITDRTKCIIPVHLFGNAVDMNAVMAVANKYNIPVIEDCAQAHGTTINGKHVGTFGTVGAFSFYPSKNVGALGDAGCIITNHATIHENISALRAWKAGDVGYNYRMDNLQAEFVSIKLKYYPKILEAKREVAEKYNQYFKNIHTVAGVTHSYNIYTILVNDREEVINKIKDRLQTRVYYPIPPSSENPYIFTKEELVYTNLLSKKQLSLPIYPSVDYKKVIEVINEIADKHLCKTL
jgi:dTDP-4-amino-4,6-dideoxygalactose transaminase|tara:strand:- start:556 stop:1626 length:1071 start_codon:yes stop_codon:yes gene_type:complete